LLIGITDGAVNFEIINMVLPLQVLRVRIPQDCAG
jgi:hypothetical protein